MREALQIKFPCVWDQIRKLIWYASQVCETRSGSNVKCTLSTIRGLFLKQICRPHLTLPQNSMESGTTCWQAKSDVYQPTFFFNDLAGEQDTVSQIVSKQSVFRYSPINVNVSKKDFLNSDVTNVHWYVWTLLFFLLGNWAGVHVGSWK